jgi:signal transduction histidine kinase
VLYDDRQLRHRINRFKLFLGFGILLMTILSAVLGYWLSGRVIAPVGWLARRVAGLRPEDHPGRLEKDFPHDEVGTLARNFDAYLERLSAFIEREQAFTADVSHELRTPLAVIEGATEVLLEDSGLDQARHARVERIARSAHEMSELVSALLLLAREEQHDVSQSSCAVSEALRQVLEGHQHLLKHKDLELRLEIHAQVFLPVECSLLRVVLANLVRNALNYTERGYVNICLDESGISVRDTGIGIPTEQIQQVFDRYFSGVDGGEGIGLSLVKRICKRYGWYIDIESEKDHGTTIRLMFGQSQ